MTGETSYDGGDQRNYDIIYCPDCESTFEERCGCHDYKLKDN